MRRRQFIVSGLAIVAVAALALPLFIERRPPEPVPAALVPSPSVSVRVEPATLRAGERRLTVEAVVPGVTGRFLSRGDLVQVAWYASPTAAQPIGSSVLAEAILEDMRPGSSASAGIIAPDEGVLVSVTLVLRHQDAQKVALAQQQGVLAVAPLPTFDRAGGDQALDLRNLLQVPAPDPQEAGEQSVSEGECFVRFVAEPRWSRRRLIAT